VKEKDMKRTKKTKDDDMQAEYDFSKAERGKYYRSLENGYTVRVRQSDGSTVVNHYTLAEGTVLLAPDVREYFSDSQSVNEALRSLINLIPEKRTKRVAEHRGKYGSK